MQIFNAGFSVCTPARWTLVEIRTYVYINAELYDQHLYPCGNQIQRSGSPDIDMDVYPNAELNDQILYCCRH